MNWPVFLFWTGVLVYLFYLTARVGRRDEKRWRHREDVLEEQRLLLGIADYITEREKRKTWPRRGSSGADVEATDSLGTECDCCHTSDEIPFALDEPDLEFQLRRSIELTQEKRSNDAA